MRRLVEEAFQAWGHWVFRHARGLVAATLLLSLALAAQIPRALPPTTRRIPFCTATIPFASRTMHFVGSSAGTIG
jgi:hypothetical protein